MFATGGLFWLVDTVQEDGGGRGKAVTLSGARLGSVLRWSYLLKESYV